jgi:uncharacterized protein (DUF362 family)
MSEPISRRDLLVSGAAVVAAGALGGACLPDVDGDWQSDSDTLCTAETPKVTPSDSSQLGRVLELEDSSLTSGSKLNATAVAAGFQKLLLALTKKSDVKTAWATLVPKYTAGQVLGIKVNTLNPKVPTHLELIQAIVASLKEGLGAGAEDILVWDRRLDELTKAGLTASALGAAVEGTWDTADGAGDGRGYEYKAICLGGLNTNLTNILTRRIDHLVNVAVLKRHDASGFTGCLKNHYGTINNPGDFHDVLDTSQKVLEKRFASAIPALNALDEVVSKTRLHVLDATIAVCKGGTESPADCIPNRLLVGLDPVAIDQRGRDLRDSLRGSLGADTETISEGWLAAAETTGIGSRTLKLEKLTK